MLGDVEETIYVVEEDEDEEEIVRVGFKLWRTDAKLAKTFGRQYTRNQRCCLSEVCLLEAL